MLLTRKQHEGMVLLNGPARRILFDGGARSGKTELLLCWIFSQANLYPGLKVLCARKYLAHAKASIWESSLKHIAGGTGCEWADHELRCPNGSVIYVDGLDDEDRTEKILGRGYGIIHLNECTALSFSTVQLALTRLSQNYGGVQKLLMDCNPKSPSHWVHRWAIEHVVPEGPDSGKPLKDAACFARLNWTPYDNLENLSSSYLETLEAMSGVARKRMLEGIWVKGEGLVYPDFDEARHVREVDCSNARQWIVAIDTGYRDPTVISLWAVLDGVAGLRLHLKELRYSEGSLLTSSIGDAMEQYRPLSPLVVVDPSSSGTLIELGARGHNVHPAMNKLVPGMAILGDLMRSDRFSISPSCKEVPLRELYALELDPMTDLPASGQPDHFCDCARYAAVAMEGERESFSRPYCPELDDPKELKPDPVCFEEGWKQGESP